MRRSRNHCCNLLPFAFADCVFTIHFPFSYYEESGDDGGSDDGGGVASACDLPNNNVYLDGGDVLVNSSDQDIAWDFDSDSSNETFTGVGQFGSVSVINESADMIVENNISSSGVVYAGDTSSNGVVLRSPDGSKFRIKVGDDGTLSTESV